MTGNDLESIKSTIAKLITLANNSGATENESRVAMERAKKLMTKHNLEEASILREKIKQGVDVRAVEESADCYYSAKFVWEAKLGWGIAPIFECKAIRGYERYDFSMDDIHRPMSFVGLPNDLSLVLFFFDYCQDEVGRHMEAAYPTRQKGSSDQKREQFATGMVMRILERLEELYERIKEEMSSECTDIVIYKQDAVEKRYRELFPNARSSRYKHIPQSKDFLKGRAAGDLVHLSSNLRQVRNGG